MDYLVKVRPAAKEWTQYVQKTRKAAEREAARLQSRLDQITRNLKVIVKADIAKKRKSKKRGKK